MNHCCRIAFLALAAAAWQGCAPADESGPLTVDTVILVSIDSLRADHLGAYGYPRPTSPTIDGLAATGTVFERAYSTTSWTLPAHAALTTRFFGLDETALIREGGKLIRWNTTGDLRYFDLRGVAIERQGVNVDPERASSGAGPAASALRELRRRSAGARDRAEQLREPSEESESEAAIDPATQEHLRALGYVE
jgi:hypothetical protein